MKPSSQIRREFIEFFASRGHTIVPSAPVIPADDPTLLFVNAGMNQFKDMFLGTGRRDYKRAVNSQKCIRVSGKHNDLEDVGKDATHHTFFEMLGNWSFGDYGKAEAIAWTWELLTKEWKLSKERLYATVHVEDDEAEELWRKETDLGAERIFRFDKENFWEMGDVGPCGPCSEIHYDLGPGPADLKLAADPKKGINSGSPRFVEIWNLVFIRFERLADGSLVPLKEKHVDTGMGFERISAVLQGKTSNFETDIFQPLIGRVSEISGKDYQAGPAGTAHRVIADHVRMLAFALADGAIPSNEGRGYVVRRILRRASRYARELNIHEPCLYSLVSTVVDLMGKAYPELVQRAQHVSQVIKAEEEGFGLTLDRGLELFRGLAEKIRGEGGKAFPGDEAFKLYDTYGFPLDLTVLLARENNLIVDEMAFKACMENQKEKSRAGGKFAARTVGSAWKALLESGAASRFTGYEQTTVETRALGADEKSLILELTPFYPEGGGQVADRGRITGEDFRFEVGDVKRTGALIVHEGEFLEGGPEKALAVKTARAEIDLNRRLATARNHTATHLMHRALLSELGENATQAGSLVTPEYLRFDFHHYEKLAEEQVLAIERKVNEEIRANRKVKFYETGYDQAVAAGAMALFNEKYGKNVRVVEVEGYSRELCGGTHVDYTGQIAAFVIASESSVASGIRRIEAYTGERAAGYLLERSHILAEIERSFAIAPRELYGKIKILLEEQKTLSRELAQTRLVSSKAQLETWLDQAEVLSGGVKVLNRRVEEADSEALKGLGDSFREKAASGAALFAAVNEGKIIFVCAVTDDLISKGKLKAGELVSRVARIAGGGGGGKPHLATAGGKDPEKLGQALEAFPALVRESLGQ